jgi:hypothetical protein
VEAARLVEGEGVLTKIYVVLVVGQLFGWMTIIVAAPVARVETAEKPLVVICLRIARD